MDLIVSNIFIVVVGFILEMARDGHKPWFTFLMLPKNIRLRNNLDNH